MDPIALWAVGDCGRPGVNYAIKWHVDERMVIVTKEFAVARNDVSAVVVFRVANQHEACGGVG